MKYLFVPVIGKIREIELSDEPGAFLDECEKLLSCASIENVVIPGGFYYMIIDGDGRCRGSSKLMNIRASPLYGGFPIEYIAGDVIIGKKGFRNGAPDIIGLSDRDINDFLRYLK